MDDLKERNKAWPAAMGHGDALSVDFVCALLAENTARLEALEAKVKEAGEALVRTQSMLESIAWHRATNFDEVHERIIANRPVLQSLAKLQEPSSDGK